MLNAGAPAERWQQFNALVKDYAVKSGSRIVQGSMPALSFIDSYNGLLTVGNSPSLYASDTIHLSADGYAYWNTWVNTIIDDLESDEGSNCTVWLSDECELYLNLTYTNDDTTTSAGNILWTRFNLATFVILLVSFLQW